LQATSRAPAEELPEEWHLHGDRVILTIYTIKGLITDVKFEYRHGSRPLDIGSRESEEHHEEVWQQCDRLMDHGTLLAAYTAMLACDGDALKKHIGVIMEGI